MGAISSAMGLLPDLLTARLNTGGYLYLEQDRREALPLEALAIKASTAGDCRFALYEQCSDLPA